MINFSYPQLTVRPFINIVLFVGHKQLVTCWIGRKAAIENDIAHSTKPFDFVGQTKPLIKLTLRPPVSNSSVPSAFQPTGHNGRNFIRFDSCFFFELILPACLEDQNVQKVYS